MFRKMTTAAAALLLSCGMASAATLSQNGLTVNINDSNGAIGSYNFGGEFFRLGAYVSDFGFQLGTSTGSFSRATASGSLTNMTVTSVNGTATGVAVNGTYQGLNFLRTYRIDSDSPVLIIETTITNPGSGPVTVRVFDTADPDQSGSFGSQTNNDVFFDAASGLTLAQATDGRSVILGSPDSDTTGAGGFGLGISSGSELNALFTSPGDPNGALADVGFAVGTELLLAAGESLSVLTYYAAGFNAADALDNIRAAAAVPVPPALPMLLAGIAGLGLLGRRRQTA